MPVVSVLYSKKKKAGIFSVMPPKIYILTATLADC